MPGEIDHAWMRDIERRLAALGAVLDERARQRDQEARYIERRFDELETRHRTQIDEALKRAKNGGNSNSPDTLRSLFSDLRVLLTIAFVIGAILGRAGIAPLESMLQ